MAGYCANCGALLTGAFCGKCGQRMQAPNTSVQHEPATKPTEVAPKRSGLAKALVITGGIVLLLFAMGIAGTFYGLHLIKKKISTYTGGAVGGSPEQVSVEQGNSCALLPRKDLQQVLGVTIERSLEMMEGSDPGCAYYTNPAAFTQLQRMAIEQARRDSAQAAQRPGPKSDNPLELLKDTKDLEGIVKTFGLTQPDKEGRVFAFTVQRDFGRNNWPAVRATMSAVPGFEDVPGVGDRAMIGSFGHAFYVLKGDSMIHLKLTYVPDAHTRGAELGRKIASHL
jgi:hypothetical protein